MSELKDIVSVYGKNPGRYLLVRIGTRQYGFDIHDVHNLIRAGAVVRVPKAQPHLMGIINLRGEIVAVMRICPGEQFTEDVITEDARIVILNLDKNRKIGILADQVYGMTDEEVTLFDMQAVACESVSS